MTDNVIPFKRRRSKADIKARMLELKLDRLELSRRFGDVRRELEDIRMILASIDYEIKNLTEEYQSDEYI